MLSKAERDELKELGSRLVDAEVTLERAATATERASHARTLALANLNVWLANHTAPNEAPAQITEGAPNVSR